jgi:hypothetical protein
VPSASPIGKKVIAGEARTNIAIASRKKFLKKY